MHKILLGIGTNIDACFNMRQATDYLLYYFPGIKFTSTIETDPFGPVYTAPFFNALAYFETDLSKDEIQLILKTIEKNMGRLDIDLVQLNNETLKSDDFKRDYMQQLLREMEQIIGHQV